MVFANRPNIPGQINVSPFAISRRNGQSLDAMELLPCMLRAINIKIKCVFRYESFTRIDSSEKKT